MIALTESDRYSWSFCNQVEILCISMQVQSTMKLPNYRNSYGWVKSTLLSVEAISSVFASDIELLLLSLIAFSYLFEDH